MPDSCLSVVLGNKAQPEPEGCIRAFHLGERYRKLLFRAGAGIGAPLPAKGLDPRRGKKKFERVNAYRRAKRLKRQYYKCIRQREGGSKA